MTKKILLLFTIALLVFAAGCGSSPDPAPEPASQPAAQPQTMSDVPQFFLMPPTAEDAFYGVGVAKMSSLDMSRTMSISQGKR